MATIQELASNLSKAFEHGKRDNGSNFVFLTEGHPNWMGNVVRDAHGEMFPDDYKYRFILEAADMLADANQDFPEDAASEIESDVYTSSLLEWLASHGDRPQYVDDAVQEYGVSQGSILQDIALGQRAEKQEVFYAVLSSLQEIVENEA